MVTAQKASITVREVAEAATVPVMDELRGRAVVSPLSVSRSTRSWATGLRTPRGEILDRAYTIEAPEAAPAAPDEVSHIPSA